MPEDLTTTLSPQAIAARDRSAPGRVSGRLKNALDRMVWYGDKRADAASAAGMTDHSLRAALRKPHVVAYYRNELALLRESERARNIHTLAAVRDDSSNAMARVKSVQVLEQLSDGADAAGIRQQRSPGVVIVIQPAQGNDAQPATIDAILLTATDDGE